ncbi:MAG TPA: CARDB domain-containing protein [Chitinophagaceae bacterium]|nr:CARDB domain-containing protein [Chitinophagaceae bacterium]
MKRLLLLLSLLISYSVSFSQSEIEPNNSFATASNFPMWQDYTASVGGGDAIDYHKINFFENASFYLLVEATNNSGNDAYLEMKMYDGREAAGELLTRTIGNNLNVPDGETVYDTIYVCAKAADTYYLSFTTNESFDYILKWYGVSTYSSDEPNNTSSNAIPFAMHTDMLASIRYEFRGGVNDTEDWFQSLPFPAGDYSNMKLNIQATHAKCNGSPANITYMVFKYPDLANPIAQGFVGNQPNVPPNYVMNSEIPLNSFVEGDQFYIRLTSTGPFGYTLRYTDMGPFTDPEDNCCTWNAVDLNADSAVNGNIGEYDFINDYFIDENDMYRFILPHAGTVKLFTYGEIASYGSYEDAEIKFDILDKYGNDLQTYNTLIGFPGISGYGLQKFDTLKFRAFEADTFYLKLYTYDNTGTYPLINYNFRYQLLDSTGSDIEPNNDTTTAILMTQGQVKKGHINFKGINGEEDGVDFYKAMLPQDGKVRVFIKAKYRGDNNAGGFIIGHPDSTGNSPNIYGFEALRIRYYNGNISQYVPPLDFIGFPPDTLFIDTVDLCPTSAGMAYFEISSAYPYEYEFSYELYDTISWVKDLEPNNYFNEAIRINPGEIKSGRVRYYEDRYQVGYNTYNDVNDYYKAMLPQNGKLKIFVEATNASCETANSLQFYAYKTDVGPDFLNRKIGGQNTVPPGVTIYDTIIPCFITEDSLYFVFNSTSSPIRYKFRYELEVVDTTDIEPNNSFAQSTRIGSGQNRTQFLGLKYSSQADVDDYFKMVVPGPDTLRLHWRATNISCDDSRIFRIYGYNKNKNQIFYKGYVSSGWGIIDAGETVADSLKVFIAAMDTVYIRFSGDGIFNYDFQTDPVKPSNWFNIIGDSTACEGSIFTYRVANFIDSNVTFHWSLPLGGGNLSFVDSVATVEWTQNGNRRIELYVSNAVGSSTPRSLNVVVNGEFPTQTPVAYNFARTLSTNSLPPGAHCQWYKNDTLITGAIDSIYYAADAGSFTVKFVNDCGPGPASNAIVFPNPALSQTISFPHTDTITMSPTARVKLLATASSGLPIQYQKISGPGNIINDSLFVTGVGTIIVKASQAGDDVYSAAASVYDTIIVKKGNQFITFDSLSNKLFDDPDFILPGTTSSGLSITYTIINGAQAAQVHYLSGGVSEIIIKGVGTVTVRASQNGNVNYNAASPVERTFCIGIRTLSAITGDANPCLATYQYRTQKVPGANYVWTLSSGGILTSNKDTAWVQWQTPGTHTISVKANSPCDTVYTNLQTFYITTSNNQPGIVSGMLPADHAIDQQLPLLLSWTPSANTVSYDLFVWDSAAPQPALPFVSNITAFSYSLPLNAPLPYNTTYKWRVVSKNPCSQTAGPIQHFRLIPLPDLMVSDVTAPASVVSGQTVTISWKITNVGPGSTLPGATWYDGVYFALDTVPFVSFRGSPNWNPSSWSSLTANGRPLLLGKKIRPSSLSPGQFYTNSIDFTLPQAYNFPVYIYVITDNEHPNWKILQVTVANDTARKATPMNITMAPVPDLRVDSVFTAGSTFSGNTVNVTYKVKNYGVQTPPGGQWVDSFFISQNPLFNRNEAIALNFPKFNDSYYPNAYPATTSHTNQLLQDSTVIKSAQVVIPNEIFGTWFIYVKTNAKTTAPKIYEGSFDDNNVNNAQIEVYLTATPKLTVSSLTVPITTASTTQPIGASWNIKNEGFKDNIERNRGHYITNSTCPVPCPPGSGQGAVCYAPSVIKDSIVFGSSYWVDRVYLSKDSGGLNINNAFLVNETKHGVEHSGFYADPFPNYISCPALVTNHVNVSNVINGGANYPKSAGFNIPDSLQPGNYYVYVYTNPTKSVFEYPGTPQIKRSNLPISIQRPDVVVSSINTPATAFGAQTININYSVLNNGPGAVFNHLRNDRIYISNFSNFDGSAQLIGTRTVTEDLPVGTPVPQSFSYYIPPAYSGNKFFYVVTNFDSSFRETNSTNNLSASAATNITAATASDLIVSNVNPGDSIFTKFTGTIAYTVVNNGAGATQGSWIDSVYISCSPTFSLANSYFIGSRTQTRTIANTNSYTDTLTVNMDYTYKINSCFPEQMYAPAYFYVVTNANNGTYEGTNTNNNVGTSGSKVVVNPLVDHIVPFVNAADTTTVGQTYTLNWSVKNIGYNPNNNDYYGWYDGIFFSSDSVASVNDLKAASQLKWLRINRNEEVNFSISPYTPNMATGDYYVYVHNNYNNGIEAEKVLNNNVNFVRDGVGAAKKIHVIQPALPDLVDSILSAPTTVAQGQPITIIYRIKNKGNFTTFPGNSFSNELRLDNDYVYNANDGARLLATSYRQTPLPPGQFYDDTVTAIIPSWMPVGNYILMGRTNASNNIIESNNTNNLGFWPLEVYEPPVTDLIVSSVTKPDTVMLGYTMDTARWVVVNNSGEQARGSTKDGIYLSKAGVFDSSAVLLGLRNKNITMNPLATDSLKMAPLVTGVVEGNYNVLVKTDIQNNIIESDEENNIGMSLSPIYVKVKELPLNVDEPNTLENVNRYYKLRIPDSLYNATILVTLKTNDSTSLFNEMYIAGNRIPTAADHDYMFEIPNYGNQQIVMTDVIDSVYYIMYRCVTPNPPLQTNMKLKAVKLPFAILNVHTNSGGNIGNVTIRIRGSLFRDSMIAKLSNGTTTIYSSAVYYTNSTQVFATFPLQGRPLGIYNVTLIKPDMSEAVLYNGFSIVQANNGGLITGGGPNTGAGNGNAPGCDPGAASGWNSQLSVEFLVPDRVLLRRPIVMQLNFSNPTNFDVPSQTRILYSEYDIKMALTKAGVPTGTTTLYLELVEPDGPPGIIRAGGSGSILIYSVAPKTQPPSGFVLFKLK